MKRDQNVIELKNPQASVKHAHVTIEGDSDLVLNKMNARTVRMLMSEDRKKIKEVPNQWEDLITAIHWRDPLPCVDTYAECNEEMMHALLTENAPCIHAFGLKKSFGEAVVRNGISKYATSFNANLNINAKMGLVPITFAEWKVSEQLMSPRKGAPVSVRLNHFCGWKAEIDLAYTEHMYNISEILNIINLAGFGLGIGSGRSSGYGRYHVVDVK